MEEGQGMRNRREGKEGQRKGWRKGPERRGGRRKGRARSWTGSLLSTPPAVDFGPRPEGAAEGRAALARSLLFYLSLTGLSTRGPAMLGHWSQHHLRL